MEDLRLLSSEGDASAENQIRNMLASVRRHLRMEVGFVSEFVEGRRVFRQVDVNTPNPKIAVGLSDPLESTYCDSIVRGTMPQLLANAADDPVAASMEATAALPIGAHLSVPITLENGETYGTLCCLSTAPDPSLNERDLDILRMCADLAAKLIDAVRRSKTDQEARQGRIDRVLRTRSIVMLYQPIYRVVDGLLLGVEAVARFPGEPVMSPDRWFKEANAIGRGEELEFLAFEEALLGMPVLPNSLTLSVNLSPALVLGPRFDSALAEQPVERLTLELTEHAAIDSYEALNTALESSRARGLRVAVDDLGAGHSSFRHVLELRPDVIKLDISLTKSIDSDRARRALAESIVRFGRESGCDVVAEGVETASQLAALQQIGVTNVQGYLAGRPMAITEISTLPAFGTFVRR